MKGKELWVYHSYHSASTNDRNYPPCRLLHVPALQLLSVSNTSSFTFGPSHCVNHYPISLYRFRYATTIVLPPPNRYTTYSRPHPPHIHSRMNEGFSEGRGRSFNNVARRRSPRLLLVLLDLEQRDVHEYGRTHQRGPQFAGRAGREPYRVVVAAAALLGHAGPELEDLRFFTPGQGRSGTFEGKLGRWIADHERDGAAPAALAAALALDAAAGAARVGAHEVLDLASRVLDDELGDEQATVADVLGRAVRLPLRAVGVQVRQAAAHRAVDRPVVTARDDGRLAARLALGVREEEFPVRVAARVHVVLGLAAARGVKAEAALAARSVLLDEHHSRRLGEICHEVGCRPLQGEGGGLSMKPRRQGRRRD